MRRIANARFAITNWDEKPYGEGQDMPRTHASDGNEELRGRVRRGSYS